MLSPVANVHHSVLPKLGEIGHVILRRNRFGDHEYLLGKRKEKWQVVAFPLSDSADQRYSRGIHTVYVQSLNHGIIKKVSGFYFEGGSR